MNDFKHMISCDWLEVFCFRSVDIIPRTYLSSSGKIYTLEDTCTSSKVFKNIYVIKLDGMEYGTLCLNPSSPIIKSTACTLKLHNRILYCQRFVEVLHDMLSAFFLEYKGITRIDLCLDCNELADGTSVPQFLHDLLFSPVHTAGHVYRKGSKKMAVDCSRTPTSGCNITAIRWGSRASNVCCYIYNKSVEMAEVKIKPWIVSAWETNGLKHSIYDKWNKLSEKQKKSNIRNGTTNTYIEESVWRWEISIKSEGEDLLNMADGELFRLSPSFLDAQDKIESLFWVYAKRMFSFRKSTGQSNTRCYPEYYPIGEPCAKAKTIKPIDLNTNIDSGRSEIMVANKLEDISRKMTVYDEDFSDMISIMVDFLKRLAGAKKDASGYDSHDCSIIRLTAAERVSRFDGLYIDLVQELYRRKKDVDADIVYNYSKSLLESVQDANLRDWVERQEKLHPTQLYASNEKNTPLGERNINHKNSES